MDERQRFLRTMRYQEVDRPPFGEGFWKETLERWRQEGLPEGMAVNEYLGVPFPKSEGVGVECCLYPPFEEKILEENGDFIIRIDHQGCTRREFKHKTSMPEYLDYPVKSRRDLEELKERLTPDLTERFPSDWEERKKRWLKRDYLLHANGGSFYGVLRNWMGVECISCFLYDERDLISEIMDMIADLNCAILNRVLTEVDVDYVSFWEDMAYKTASLISPQMFRELMLPCYKKVTAVARSKGQDILHVDSDGNIDELIPLWLEGGVNCFSPLERAAGMDPVSLRNKYGREILLFGGVDKRALAKSKNEIDTELARLKGLIKQGGYIPSVDHGVPPDVSFDNYKYYIESLKKIYH